MNTHMLSSTREMIEQNGSSYLGCPVHLNVFQFAFRNILTGQFNI